MLQMHYFCVNLSVKGDKRMDYYDRIDVLLKEKKDNAKNMCSSIGLSYNTFNGQKRRHSKNIDMYNVQRIADYLGTTTEYLINGSTAVGKFKTHPINKIKIPVLGNVACGQPIFAEESLECYVDAIDNIKADFALWAKGDSMIEARINDGDLVFIKQQEMVENGEIAAVLIEDEATLKKVFYEPNKNRLMLVSANRNYQPFIYEGEDLEKIKILGKAVAFQSNL